MPQVFSQNGGAPVVPAPMLSGNYIPNIDTLAPSGLGLVSPWGSGANIRRYSPSSGTTLTPASAAIQDSLALLAASISPTPPIVNFNFEGLVGPQGPPGPSVAPIIYEVVPWGANQADYPPAVFMGDLSVDFPMTNGITFSQDGTACDWTVGTLTYKGTTYEISAGSAVEANKWIYWDSNSSPTTFSSTATLATAIGTTKWVMAYHVSGDPSLALQSKIIHGGLIEADTIDATHINVSTLSAISADMGTITAGNISAARITTGELLADRIVVSSISGLTTDLAGGYASEFSGTAFITGGSGGSAWLVMDTATLENAIQDVTIAGTILSSGATGDLRFRMRVSGVTKWESELYENIVNGDHGENRNATFKPAAFGVSVTQTMSFEWFYDRDASGDFGFSNVDIFMTDMLDKALDKL